MATTGVAFSLRLNEKIGHDYSAYFDPARANDIIQEAFIKAIEVKYQDLTKEKNTDELQSLITTNSVVNLTNNVVSLSAIPSYLHTLAIKTQFLKPLTGVKGASNANPIVLILPKLTDLRDGDQINVSGVQGNTNANGTYYVKELYNDFENQNFTFQLFTDQFLTIPVVGNGTYTKGGSVSKVVEAWAKKKESYRKYSTFGEPDIDNCFYEISLGNLNILPPNYACTQIRIDYINKPTIYPNVTDNNFDLEILYPLRFLYFLEDETAKLMAEYSRDIELGQSSQAELLQP